MRHDVLVNAQLTDRRVRATRDVRVFLHLVHATNLKAKPPCTRTPQMFSLTPVPMQLSYAAVLGEAARAELLCYVIPPRPKTLQCRMAMGPRGPKAWRREVSI